MKVSGQSPRGYRWTENEEEMEVCFLLPTGTAKGDVRCELRMSQIEVGLANSTTLLSGKLMGRIDVDSSAWIFDGGDGAHGDTPPTLTISLSKHESAAKIWGCMLWEESEI